MFSQPLLIPYSVTTVRPVIGYSLLRDDPYEMALHNLGISPTHGLSHGDAIIMDY